METLLEPKIILRRITGHRAALFFSGLFFLTLLSSCQKPSIPQSGQIQDSPFTALVDYRRSNYLALSYPDSFKLIKKVSLNGAPVSTLLRSGQHVLFATLPGYLYSLNAENVAAKYNTRLAKAASRAPSLQNTLLALAAEKGKYGLIVYDLLHQRILWREEGLLSRSAPIILGKRLIHLSLKGILSAFDLASGKPLWQVSVGHKVFVDAAGDENMLAVLSRDGWLQTFNPANGALIWQRPFKDSFYVPPLINQSTIFIAGYSGACWAMARHSGEIVWRQSAVSPVLAPLAADETNLYLVSANGLCRALDANSGIEQWQHLLEGPLSAAPLVTAARLWLGTSQKQLISLDKHTGRRRNKITLPGRPLTAPLLVNHEIFIACEYSTMAIYGMRNEQEK